MKQAIVSALLVLFLVNFASNIDGLPFEDIEESLGAGWGGPDSVELTDANLEKTVENPAENWMWIVYRPTCGNCKRTNPEWKKAATQLKGSNIKLGHIDCDKNSKYWKYFNEGFTLPQILFMSKTDKTGDEKYKGERTASNLVPWGKERATP